ncbi:carbohydrate ABC transporter permease [Mesoaciditoga lauensis]|uniref:carbohydrate ABC transporter permease n=1 Tax=Mesoaciditoga lauensis TaxID=1495039 RepID=UPI0005626C69|nr:carbohydrate ABC transporter permease [Mesoaciditoga lauensis]
MNTKKKKVHKMYIYIALTLLTLIVAFPLYYAIITSTLSMQETYMYPPKFLPSTHFIGNIVAAWKSVNMSRMMFNSVFISTVVALAKVFISLFAAFALTYFGKFKGKALLFGVILSVQMLPLPVRIVPTFALMKDFGWVNTYFAITIPFFATTTGILLYRQFFLQVPNSISDAARIDGATSWRFFWSILFPMTKNVTAALFIIEFIFIWGQYLWPLIVTNSSDMRVVQIGVKMMLASEAQAAQWNVIMAGSLLVILPPLAVFLVFHRSILKGFGLKEEK